MINTPPKHIYTSSLHPALQFFILVILLVTALFIGSIIGAGIVWASFGEGILNDVINAKIASHQAQNALWIIQLTGTTLPILATPVFFAYVIVRDPDDYLKPGRYFPWVLIVLVFATMMISSPLIEWLSNINQKMVLPPSFKGIEKWMRESEDSAQKLSDGMLQMKTIGSLVFDLLFIGLITATVEELLFRGCMQTIFLRWTKNYHAAVWITAIIFSAFHMEFYGFLPRVLLGALFGYFVVWSGSIWTSIFAHFVNNGTAVLITYLFQHKLISTSPDDQHVFNSYGYIISLVITVFLLLLYRYVSTKHNPYLATDGKELD